MSAFSCGNNNNPNVSDSLSQTDSLAALQLKKRIDKIKFANPDSALILLSQFREINDRNHYANGMMDFYFSAANIHLFLLSDTAVAKTYVDSARQLSGVPGNERLKCMAYVCEGAYYFHQEQYQKASTYYLKALSELPVPSDSILYFNICQALSGISYHQRNFDDAFDYHEPVIRHVMQQPNSALKVLSLMNGFVIANKATATRKAYASHYLFAARKVAEAISDTSAKAILYSNLATYYQSKGITDSSVFFAQKALKVSKGKQGPLNDVTVSLEVIAQHQLEQGDFAGVKRTIGELESVEAPLQFSEMIYESTYYDLKYGLLKHENNIPAALTYLEKKVAVDEKLSRIEKDDQLLTYRKELKKLAADKTIAAQNGRIEKQHVYTVSFIIISLLLLLLAGIIYLYWRNKRKREVEKWESIQRQEAYESQMKLLEERSRIAREMHDDLGSTLTSTLMAVELVRLKPGDPMPMEMIDRSANQLNDQINDIIWNMNEKNDDLRNLCDYIFRFASDFLQEASITLSLYEDIPEDKIPVTGQDRRRIYLCVKELFNNIVKHATATRVELHVSYQANMFHISINDNGVGLNGSHKDTAGSGYGLNNIKKNIAIMNGKIQWQAKQPGTQVHISLPL
ncbi:MAG: ATP-binding protein [Taibaiella sp.]